MRTRLRLGAAAAVGLGALLLATVLASPALAWHSNVTVSARCLEGQVRIHYTVEAWEKQGHEATVDVSYKLNGEVTELQSEDHFFGPQHNQFSDHFDLPAGTTGTITFLAVAHWSSGETSSDKGSAELPPADKCEDVDHDHHRGGDDDHADDLRGDDEPPRQGRTSRRRPRWPRRPPRPRWARPPAPPVAASCPSPGPPPARC